MFLLVSVQSCINLGKTFLRISHLQKNRTDLNFGENVRIFIFQILDFICVMVLTFIFDCVTVSTKLFD